MLLNWVLEAGDEVHRLTINWCQQPTYENQKLMRDAIDNYSMLCSAYNKEIGLDKIYENMFKDKQ